MGRGSNRKQILVHFELEKKTNLIVFVIFTAHIYSQIHKANFHIFSHSLGVLGPSGPLWLRQWPTCLVSEVSGFRPGPNYRP